MLTFIAGCFILYKPSCAIHLGKKISGKKFKYAVIPGIGFYDGMFGPGTGSFFTLGSVLCRRAKLVAATAVAKPLNFATNLSSLIVFAVYGNVVWHVGLVMMLGQFIGAWVGIHFLYRIDPNKLRLLVVFVCIVMLARYVYSSDWITK